MNAYREEWGKIENDVPGQQRYAYKITKHSELEEKGDLQVNLIQNNQLERSLQES
jgi:hypothetical protein